MGSVEFLEKGHIYNIIDDNDNKTPVPSVTTILKAAGLYNENFFTEASRTRGTYVHKAILYYLQDDLVEETIPDEYRGYIEAFKRFMAEADCKPHLEMCEVPLFSEVWRFGGMPDIPCVFNGAESIIDVKSGAKSDTTGVQLAAYALLHPIPSVKRYGLYLKANGKYRLIPYLDRNDTKIFNAALTLYHWRQTEGLL